MDKDRLKHLAMLSVEWEFIQNVTASGLGVPGPVAMLLHSPGWLWSSKERDQFVTVCPVQSPFYSDMK